MKDEDRFLEDERLKTYAELLVEVASKLGLSGIKDSKKAYELHILDSLALLEFVPSGKVADIGSGAGLPGIPLAIFKPETEFWLVDSRRKAASFLDYVKTVLGLKNVKVVRARVEDLHGVHANLFDAVCARALAPLGKLWKLSEPLLKKGGFLLALKGPKVKKEIEGLSKNLKVEVFPYEIPSRKGLVVKVTK